MSNGNSNIKTWKNKESDLFTNSGGNKYNKNNSVLDEYNEVFDKPVRFSEIDN